MHNKKRHKYEREPSGDGREMLQRRESVLAGLAEDNFSSQRPHGDSQLSEDSDVLLDSTDISLSWCTEMCAGKISTCIKYNIIK